VATWSTAIELVGAGGEPVNFARTLVSHGVADLPPNEIAPDGTRLSTILTAGEGAWLVEVTPDGARRARLGVPAGAIAPPAAHRPALSAQITHMLRLDEDLSAFYLVAASDPALAWVITGAGRMMRSPTVFEDLVKTLCTTNCTWSATVRMVSALVGELGTAAAGASQRRAFPAPAVVAEAGDAFFRDVARAGYRGPYLRAVADDVAAGRIDLETLRDPALPDQVVADLLLQIAGVGPYAMAHMMMLLGRYRRIILDSWTRPKYRHVSGRPRITDKGIERAFRRYRQFAGLAFWLMLTEDWLPPE
jgi:3-methyladenine DNA glycosylase/8-oxoguanine DNA glycosylase